MLPHFFQHRKTQKSLFSSVLLIGAATLALSACGWQWPDNESWKEDPLAFMGSNQEANKNTPAPPIVIPQDSPDQHSEQAKLLPASTMGLNLQTYFAQDIQDPNMRMKRLENALIAMHEDMKKMSGVQPVPAYRPPPVEAPQALAAPAPESNREVLVSGGPQNLAPQDTATPVTIAPPPAPAPAPEAAPAPAPTPAAAPKPNPPVNGATYINDVRIGEHADKIRIVLDVSKKTLYTADLDNKENLLVVELPDAGWNTAATKSFGKMPVLKSYRVDPYNDGAGNIVVFQLDKGTSILSQSQIPALSGGGQRIFIDLAK